MMHRRCAHLFLLGLAAALLAGALFLLPQRQSFAYQAQPTPQPTAKPTIQPGESTVDLSVSNETCLGCHNNPNLNMVLGNGEVFNLYVPADIYAHSIHGTEGYACVQCHTTVGNYPHPPFEAEDARDVSLKLYPVCSRCHAAMFDKTKDSVHAAAQAAGNRNAAVCTDCHSAHAVRQLRDPATGKLLPDTRQWIPQTCSRCHYAIYQKYLTSVHGAELTTENNPDVPTCIDCHGVHNISDPRTAAFRLQSPELCARCHTDASIMDKYGISTQVLNTYVADFHGTTISIFEKEHPDQESNKAVCYDCHGVHDIKRVDDPVEGLRIKQNLLARCKVCHPDASSNFPTAWLSHYIPSPQRNPLVFTVNTFYAIFIPAVLGGMAILVAMDAGNFISRRVRRRKPVQKVAVFPVQEKPAASEEKPAEAQPAQGEEQQHG
jgi:predicted CXXCH cytochrome family protein